MMTPYRSMELVQYVPSPPRSQWKTLIYKFLIWKHGTFRVRFKDKKLRHCLHGGPPGGECNFRPVRTNTYDQFCALQKHYFDYINNPNNEPKTASQFHAIENHRLATLCDTCHWRHVNWWGIYGEGKKICGICRGSKYKYECAACLTPLTPNHRFDFCTSCLYKSGMMRPNIRIGYEEGLRAFKPRIKVNDASVSLHGVDCSCFNCAAAGVEGIALPIHNLEKR